jgi:hypothetical protein
MHLIFLRLNQYRGDKRVYAQNYSKKNGRKYPMFLIIIWFLNRLFKRKGVVTKYSYVDIDVSHSTLTQFGVVLLWGTEEDVCVST